MDWMDYNSYGIDFIKKQLAEEKAAAEAAEAKAKADAAAKKAAAEAAKKKHNKAFHDLVNKGIAFQKKYYIVGDPTKLQIVAFFGTISDYIDDLEKHNKITDMEKHLFINTITKYALKVVKTQSPNKIYTIADITNIWKTLFTKNNNLTYFTKKDYKKQFRFYRNKPAKVEMRTSTDKGKTWSNWKDIAGTRQNRQIPQASNQDSFGNVILDNIDGAFETNLPILGSELTGHSIGYLAKNTLTRYVLIKGSHSKVFSGVNTFGFSQDIYDKELLIGSETGNYAELQEL